MKNYKLIKQVGDDFYNDIYYFIKSKENFESNFDFEITNIQIFDNLFEKLSGVLNIRVDFERENVPSKYYNLHFEGTYDKKGLKIYNFSIEENLFLNKKNEENTALNEFFVGYYKAEDFDKIANEILNKYFPEYTLTEGIDGKVIAERLGLKIKYRTLSQDSSIFGLFCFEDTMINTWNGDKLTQEKIEANTIVVDSNAVTIYGGENSENFIVIHECVHYIMHKKFYFYNCSNDETTKALSCYTDGKINNGLKNELQFVERQANEIAARVLLPIKKFNLLFNNFKQICGSLQEYAKLSFAVDMCKDYFKVSRQTVLIRLRELGATDIIGLYEFIDGRYVKAYTFKDFQHDDNISFSISRYDYMVLYATDPSFRKEIDTGAYVYVDSHVCLNDDKYLFINDQGQLELTDYARDNIQECCLFFKYVYEKHDATYSDFDYMLHKRYCKDRKHDIFYPYPEQGKTLAKEKLELIEEELKKFPAGADLKTMVDILRKERNLTQNELAERAKLDENTIKRIDGSKIKVETLMAICIGLKIPMQISRVLFLATNNNIDAVNQKMICYNNILNSMYNEDIDTINSYLKDFGFNPLTRNDF